MDETVKLICQTIDNKKGKDISIIDVAHLTPITDYFVICSGTSTTHVKTLCDDLLKELSEHNIIPTRKEGYSSGRWIVLDCNSVIIHIFLNQEREFYNIEDLWADDNNYTEYKSKDQA